MYKAYKFRMYPNKTQQLLIHKTFGCYRFIYNYFLNKCKLNGYIKAFDMCCKLKELYIEYPWLKEVDSCSLRCAIFNLEDAYKNFFQKRSKYPMFKSKYSRQSYRTNCMRSEYKGKKFTFVYGYPPCTIDIVDFDKTIDDFGFQNVSLIQRLI